MNKDDPGKEKKPSFLQKDPVWTFTTYFTEGFPYTIIRTISPVFFRDIRVSLEAVGLTSLFDLPWLLKFLWGPQVDAYSTKRRWLLTAQFLLVLMIIGTAILAPLENTVQYIAILFFVGAFVAATLDIAIDGYYMEALDKDGQAKFVGYRVMAYRVAMLTGSGLIIHLGTTVSWFTAFLTAAIIFGLFFLFQLFFLREVETIKKRFFQLLEKLWKLKKLMFVVLIALAVVGIRAFFRSGYYKELADIFSFLKKVSFSHWIALSLLLSLAVIALFRKKIKARLFRDPDSHYSRAFMTFVDRERIAVILAFIILLRTGEFMLSTMARPYFVDLGIKKHISWLSAGVGLPATVVGALVGGWAISRFSLRKMILPFILAQNLTNVVYMVLAFRLQDFVALNTGVDNPAAIGIFNMFLVALVHGFDQFASGLGMAVLMTFLMRLCLPSFKAAHYAIGSALMGLGGMFSGIMSGFVASWVGYAWMFGISFLLAVPAMVLIRHLPDSVLDVNRK